MGFTFLWALVGLAVCTSWSTTESTTGDSYAIPVVELSLIRREINKIEQDQHNMQEALKAAQEDIGATKIKIGTTKTQLETRFETTKTQLEAKLETAKTQFETTNSEVVATKTQLETTITILETTQILLNKSQGRLDVLQAQIDLRGGTSVFVGWGWKTCPNKTTEVYAGFIAGKHHNKMGGGTNYLCLPPVPGFDNTAKALHYGLVYRAQYQEIPTHARHIAPCPVCLSSLPSTIMVPATLSCPQGWSLRYTGHLASQYWNHRATQYVCISRTPESLQLLSDDNQALLYRVIFQCGKFPCSPYISNRVLTCVVCSK